MVYRFFSLFLFFFSFIPSLYSQIYFEKTYGSIYDDEAHFIEKTADGGFIVTGRSKARNGSDYDIFLLKINKNGVQDWFNVINNPGNDWGRGVRQTSDNGYIVCGELAVTGGLDYTLAKFDNNGNKKWQKTYNKKASDRPSFLQITSDGGYFVCGYSETSSGVSVDGFLLKTDKDGKVIFSLLLDNSDNEALYGMVEVSDGYITTGYSNTGSTSLINKISKTGTLLWSRELNAGSGSNGFFQSSLYNSNIVTARSTDRSGTRDIWVYKFDLNGNTVWSKAMGTSLYDEAFGLIHNPYGDFVVAGFSAVNAASFNGTLFRCDENGIILWSKTYGGINDDRLYDVKSMGFDGNVACGYTASSGNGNKDIYILRIDNDGNAGSTCSYASAGISSIDFTPSVTNPALTSTAVIDSTTVNPILSLPIIVTTDVCDNALPVTLVSFKAKWNGRYNELQWYTAQEVNANRFIIERSMDGDHFLNIGTVDAEGSETMGHAYIFEDEERPQGTSYYRLRKEDVDGKFAYSEIKVVFIETQETVFISPNPNNGSFNILLTGQTSTVNIQVHNALGIMLYQSSYAAAQTISFPISLIGQRPGMYIVSVTNEHSTTTSNIIVE
jgi:hypothetical protein